ncbi:MAG: hypothetical protein EOP00_18785 [Pedobacter sp.]|nr:MAG: hypothetical protein EOP00_18785 [Pedobacter sp.]
MKFKDIKIGGDSYGIYYIKGTVVGKDKHLETRISGGGGGGYSNQGTGYSAAVSISSRTITHDKIFLLDENGKEHAAELTDWDVACREGHQMLMQQVVKGNKASGPYVCVANLTTDTVLTKNHKIQELFANATIRTLKDSLPLMYLFIELLILAGIYYVGGSIDGTNESYPRAVLSNLGLLLVVSYIGYRIFLRNKKNANAKLLEAELRSFAKTHQN